MTRTLDAIFAPAIANATRLAYLHPRIQREPTLQAKARQIECCFRSGRITGCDKHMLLDLYVRDI
jgi:hypothetical protein